MKNYLIAFNLEQQHEKVVYGGKEMNRYEAICEFFREIKFNYLTNMTWGFMSDMSAREILDDLYKKNVFYKDEDIVHIIEVNTGNWAYDRHHWYIP
ncbi:MAG: hypothetical protein U0354_19510 [Candidatus Sericytochromatia bacterium]